MTTTLFPSTTSTTTTSTSTTSTTSIMPTTTTTTVDPSILCDSYAMQLSNARIDLGKLNDSMELKEASQKTRKDSLKLLEDEWNDLSFFGKTYGPYLNNPNDPNRWKAWDKLRNERSKIVINRDNSKKEIDRLTREINILYKKDPNSNLLAYKLKELAEQKFINLNCEKQLQEDKFKTSELYKNALTTNCCPQEKQMIINKNSKYNQLKDTRPQQINNLKNKIDAVNEELEKDRSDKKYYEDKINELEFKIETECDEYRGTGAKTSQTNNPNSPTAVAIRSAYANYVKNAFRLIAYPA
jgi:hypothetical protein